ncbi:HAD-IC family P-type ATPase [Actinacidiphila acidipaludis]|uniref:HAD-IC family P-type ATPase n=1 Tax=Actinacidiphila acidipaludis TaxID=2873382 RepID=UPI0027E0D8DF|nr:HAD-IC family P-type ATPase [Streptomyces acidipaludis]
MSVADLTDLADAGALEVLRRLGTGPRGLTEAEAEERLALHGENTVPGQRPASWPRRFLASVRDPFTAVLLCLGVVSALVASWGTACVITVLILVSCGLRVRAEHRADRSAAGLRQLVAATATVQRRAAAGSAPRLRELPVALLVPGDVIRLGPGDVVPADVRLLRARHLTVHQAVLTGESAAATKEATQVPLTLTGAGDFERPHLCFQGSSVGSGSGTAVVTATGPHTRFARAHHERGAHGGRRVSAFDRAVNGISWILVRFMLLIPPLVLAADAAVRGRGLATLPFAVAVAVGLTPEMLPVVVATVLARRAAVLARDHRVIVRWLPALHNLGAMDVLCTDKTGTLTLDRPVVDACLDPAGRPDEEVLRWAAVNSLWTLQLADLPVADALDEAILDAAGGRPDPPAGRSASAAPAGGAAGSGTVGVRAVAAGGRENGSWEQQRWEIGGWEGVAALPFDPARRVSTAVVRRPGRRGRHTLVVKGAVEDVLDRCTRVRVTGGGAGESGGTPSGGDASCAEAGMGSGAAAGRAGGPGAPAAVDGTRPLTAAERERLSAMAAARAEEGLRLLAVAVAERPARLGGYRTADEQGLVLAGFVALRDTLAPTATAALSGLADRGITVKVVTGDHPGTAARVCRDLGLDPGEVVGAGRIEALDDPALAELAMRTTVFARCTPEHKARIVRVLRQAGHVTGFLGDGVNDLPALHAADVGICPGDAVDVTRDAADTVLAGRDLTAIGHAVAAGRHCTGTLGTYLRITLSSNFGNVIAMLAAGLLLPFLPMLPAQVLLQNLCFDAAQLAFAADRPAPEALRRPAVLRPPDFLRFVAAFGVLNAAADLTIFAVLVGTVPAVHHSGGQVAFHAGWFTENLITQALVMLLLRPGRGRSRGTPAVIRAAAAALAATGVLLPLSPLAPALGMTALPSAYYLLLGAVLALYAATLHLTVRPQVRRPARPA